MRQKYAFYLMEPLIFLFIDLTVFTDTFNSIPIQINKEKN